MNSNPAIAAALAIQTAEAQVERALLEEILQRIGLQEIEGVPIPQWRAARLNIELEKVLLAMGDTNPAAHDAVRACIAEALKKKGA